MFSKLLIANRGEIACRIIRTARRLGIRTVAVYSDADAGALHVSLADEACHIGPAPARDSYLCAGAILQAALQCGAEAVHPGYGFLAENAGFAEGCLAAGLTFVGPPATAIEAMGSKSAAKQIMAAAGVPLVPGYHGAEQDLPQLYQEALKIGFPLLIKASAGGGGKGMRVVETSAAFAEALAAARREAAAAFGDETVLLEKYLGRPRHIEIQVFADSHGNVVHLFERDCSIQRRHQKVIEEAPAPGLSAELREQIGSAATAAARAIGYVGAGTVEFLLDEDNSFYFMEMNTRLQVEHPVTEMITGQDLVEWQLVVANGGELPCRQEELSICGHAIEARIYAEDPDREFLPSTGVLRHLRTPAPGPHLRIDSGIREKDEVSIHYDPMLAKLIVWDRDRRGALRRLQSALADYQVVGVTTNLGFLACVAAHPAFSAGAVDTGFIPHYRADLLHTQQPACEQVLALAGLATLLERNGDAARAAASSADPFSPWHQTGGWRLNSDNHHQLLFHEGEKVHELLVHYRPLGYLIELPTGPLLVSGSLGEDGELLADLGGSRVRATIIRQGNELSILRYGRNHRLVLHDPALVGGEQESGDGKLTAPMPGKVVKLLVETGSHVRRGTPLVILEAMKMEHTIQAPADGTVTSIHFGLGALVNEGAQLLAFEAEKGE